MTTWMSMTPDEQQRWYAQRRFVGPQHPQMWRDGQGRPVARPKARLVTYIDYRTQEYSPRDEPIEIQVGVDADIKELCEFRRVA